MRLVHTPIWMVAASQGICDVAGGGVSRVLLFMDIDHFIQHDIALPLGQDTHGRVVGLTHDELFEHLVMFGKTGTGKSTLLRNAIIVQVALGNGLCLIDPHGDLADDISAFIPPHRLHEVIWIDLDDISHGSVGINVVEKTPQDERMHVVGAVISAFKGYFGHSWGPRLEYILTHALLAHTSIENSSILGVQKMLSHALYRRWVVAQCDDPAVRAFWRDEFEAKRSEWQQEAIAPIQNKLGALVMSPHTRNIFGQIRSTVSFRWAMDHRKIILVRLPKGRISDDLARLTGSVIVTLITQAALSRADVAREARVPFTLFIDEVQNFATSTFVSAFSELRKYRVGLCLATQYSAALASDIQHAIFGNVGTMLSFRVGIDDAEYLARSFARVREVPFEPHEFTELEKYHTFVNFNDRGPAMLTSLLPFESGFRHNRAYDALRQSRERYMRPRAEIEGKIARWHHNWEEGRMPHERHRDHRGFS